MKINHAYNIYFLRNAFFQRKYPNSYCYKYLNKFPFVRLFISLKLDNLSMRRITLINFRTASYKWRFYCTETSDVFIEWCLYPNFTVSTIYFENGNDQKNTFRMYSIYISSKRLHHNIKDCMFVVYWIQHLLIGGLECVAHLTEGQGQRILGVPVGNKIKFQLNLRYLKGWETEQREAF